MAIGAPSTIAPEAPSTQCPIPWCHLDHSDPMMDGLVCHLGNLEFMSGLGVGIGQSDDSAVRVEATWDWAAHSEMLYWTPRQAREVAQRLLHLADLVEDTAGLIGAQGNLPEADAEVSAR